MQKKIQITLIPMVLLLAGATLLAHGGAVEKSPSQSVTVKVDNFTFAPLTLTVPVNSTVTWENKDDVPHVVADKDGSFKSKALDTDDKYSYTFSKPGTYQYYCPIHPKMVGKVVVQ